MYGVSGRASRGSSSNEDAAPARAPGKQTRSAAGADAAAHAAAEVGFSGSGGALPHREAIQRSFGHHDVSNVSSFSDTFAQKANRAMGSEAFASGDRVAFAGSPDLHTAAHEAAHVVQQRKGAGPGGGVGRPGDSLERAADAAADAVVRGDSAQALLDAGGGSGGGGASGGAAVQHKVPDGVPTETVTAHFEKLIALHELDEGAKTGELASAIADCNTAQEAMDRLDARLDPTARLKALVRAGDFQGALEEVVRVYRPAAGVTYKVQATDDYAKVLPQGTPIPPGIPFGVVSDGTHATGKDAVIYMHHHWIQRWILENQIGSLINTIEHESTHANQKNLATTELADNNDVMEFEAYTHEILLVDRKAKTETSPLPTQAQLQKAYNDAKTHYAGLKSSVPPSKHAKYDKIWTDVEKVIRDLLDYLDRRDERRGASGPEEDRFMKAVAEYTPLGAELAEVEKDQRSYLHDDFTTLHSREIALQRKVLLAHQELHASAKTRHQPLMDQADAIHNEFVRYDRNGPRPSKARKPAKQASSGGGLGLGLPPPPGGFGSFLPPPSGFAQLAPPPKSEEQQKKEADDFADFADFADFGEFQSASDGGGAAVASSAKKKDDDFDDFADFGEFQSASDGGGAAAASSAKKKDDDFDDFDFGEFQSASTTGDGQTPSS